MQNIRGTDLLITSLAPIIWGSTYVATTELLPSDTPLLASLMRALPAGLLLLVLCQKLPTGLWWMRATVLGVLNIGLFFYLLFESAYRLPGGIAALVMSCQPVIVLLLSALLLKEPIKAIKLIACVLGATGVALLVLKPSSSLDMVGVIAGLAGALSMSLGVVLTKRWGRPEGVSMLNFTGWQLTAGGIFLLPLTLVLEPLPTEITANNLLGFAYLGIIGAVLAYSLWFRGIERLNPTITSFIGFASPLTAVILGFILLDETLSLFQFLGAAAIIGAIFIAQYQPKKSTTKARA